MARSLAKSGAFSTLYVMYGSAAAFAATLIVSNGVGEAGAGAFFQIMAFFAIAISLSVFGADTGLVRTISAQRALGRYHMLPKLLRFAFIPATLFALLLTLAALALALPQISPDLSDQQRTAIFVAAPFLIFATWMTLCFGALRGLGHTVEFTFLQSALLPTLRILAVGLAVFLSGSMIYLALAWSLPVILVLLLALIWVRRYMPAQTGIVRYRPRHMAGNQAQEDQAAEKKDASQQANQQPIPSQAAAPAPAASQPAPAAASLETAKSFCAFSSARGVSAMVETVLEWIDVLLIGLFLGPAASGIYGAVNRCVRVGAMVEHTARVVTGPEISAAIALADRQKASRIFVSATQILICVGWPFFISLAAFGHLILGFFGSGFTAGAPLFYIIGAAMLVQMAAGGVQSVLLMSGKARWQLYNKLTALALALTLNLTLIPLWGLQGAATAWAAAVLADCGLATYQVYMILGIRPQLKEVLPIMALAGGTPALGAGILLFLLGTSWWALLAYLLLVMPLYLLLIYRFRSKVGLEKLVNSFTRKLRR